MGKNILFAYILNNAYIYSCIKINQRKDQNRVSSLAIGKDCILVPWAVELGVIYWGSLQEGRCLLSCFKLKIDLL